ncbi:hypothetical protein ACLMAJ_17550 [Nocardia sp. KC 131]|uniref:hypothetical protein n=1 Tax=Nocardia arseniciresistens TaxID=3392119 RepID=UPI00398F0CAB
MAQPMRHISGVVDDGTTRFAADDERGADATRWLLDADRATAHTTYFGNTPHTDAGVWDWMEEKLPDWPAERIDDAGLTLSETVSHALQTSEGKVQVELRSTGERGNRELQAVVRDTGTTPPPEGVLEDAVHGRLDYQLHDPDSDGWTRQVSMSVRESRPLAPWLDEILDRSRYPRVSVDGETGIAVRSRDYTKLARELSPYHPSSSPEVARNDNDREIRHKGRVNDARLWAGNSNLEPAIFTLQSGVETTDLPVYPVRNKNFDEGWNQLGIAEPSEHTTVLGDFAKAAADGLQQGRPTPLPEE